MEQGVADLWHHPLVSVDNLKQFFKMFSNVLQLFRLFLFLFPPLLLPLPLPLGPFATVAVAVANFEAEITAKNKFFKLLNCKL